MEKNSKLVWLIKFYLYGIHGIDQYFIRVK